jgi:hypothetical protein
MWHRRNLTKPIQYHPDGRKRTRPPASTIHGWLAKMRGTLIGDEKLRSSGMREMREARAMRKYNKEKAQRGEAHRRSSKPSYTSSFSIFGSKKPTGSRATPRSRYRADSHRLVASPRGRGRPVQQRRSQPTTRRTTNTTRRGRPRA